MLDSVYRIRVPNPLNMPIPQGWIVPYLADSNLEALYIGAMELLYRGRNSSEPGEYQAKVYTYLIWGFFPFRWMADLIACETEWVKIKLAYDFDIDQAMPILKIEDIANSLPSPTCKGAHLTGPWKLQLRWGK